MWTSYNLQYRVTGSGSGWTQITGLTGLTHIVTGLAPGTTYDFQIEGSNGSIPHSGFSNTVTGTTLSAVPASVADLWFSPTAGFIDITAQSSRRNFISLAGAAQNLGTDGSAPFQVTPPVFLTSNGIPSSFAINRGRGGAFVITGGAVAASASNPPAASETAVATPGGPPGAGVLGDYLTGNLYAWNPSTLTDNGTQKRWVRRWRALAQGSPQAKRFSSLAVSMQTGDAVPNGAAPQMMLRWSDDGGSTWSDTRIGAVGRLGQTTQIVKFNRLGMTSRFGGSDRIFELSSADQFAVALLDAEVDVS